MLFITAMEQAQAWIPRQKQHEFEKIMMPKFAERKQSKEYVKKQKKRTV
jgi:hypothetical protein